MYRVEMTVGDYLKLRFIKKVFPYNVYYCQLQVELSEKWSSYMYIVTLKNALILQKSSLNCIFFRIHLAKQLIRITFYAPGLKGLPGASSNRIVRLFVCLSIILSHLQTKCKNQSLGDDTVTNWTVSSSVGTSDFTEIPCPWVLGGVEM